MCEAHAYLYRDGKEELIMESVDLIEPEAEGTYRLVNIFNQQKIIAGRIKSMRLVEHKVVFEPAP